MDIASRLKESLERLSHEQGAWLSADMLRTLVGSDVSLEQIFDAAQSLCEAGLIEERAGGQDEYGTFFDLDAQEYREAKSEGAFICPRAGEPRPLSLLAPYFAFPAR